MCMVTLGDFLISTLCNFYNKVEVIETDGLLYYYKNPNLTDYQNGKYFAEEIR